VTTKIIFIEKGKYKMARKKIVKKEVYEDEIKIHEQLIYGAFIKARRVIQNNLTDEFMIKLSSITQFYNTEDEIGCVFYTYKDCCYFVPLNAETVRKAINSFIFTPETHWESYGL